MISALPVTEILAALLIGLASSAHCVFMCGGISSAFQASEDRTQGQQLLFSLLFQVGRLLSYALIGLLLGSVVAALGSVLELGFWLRMLAGVLLIAMGLYLANIWRGLASIEKLFMPVWLPVSLVAKRFMPARNALQALAVGALWGWLPCGLVYSTLVWAAASGSALESALLMFAMGIGTLPAMFGVGLFGQVFRQKVPRFVGAMMLCVFGLWTMTMPTEMLFNRGEGADHSAHTSVNHQHFVGAHKESQTEPQQMVAHEH